MKKFINNIWIVLIASLFMACDDNSGPGLSSDRVGEGTLQGSLNRFTVSGDFLYVINNNSLIPYNISNPSAPIEEAPIEVNIGIETVITKDNLLFIGANDGMYIFDISNKANPNLLSVYRHIVACDPVAVQGNYAYVTLRTDNQCNIGIDVLDVVDISDPNNPREVFSTPMTNPHGLGAEGENLFVSEGLYGLAHFNISDPKSPQLKEHLDNIPHNVDVIAADNQYYKDLLVVTGKDGIYQYDYSDGNLKLLSQLSFQ